MFKNKFKVLIILICLCLLNFNVQAKKPSNLIIEIVDQASSILSSNSSANEKIMKLNEIAENNVDIKGIGFYTLGKYKKTISSEDQDKYAELFRKYFLKSFSSRLVTYTDPKINVISEKVINEKYTIVNSVLVATEKRPEVKIDWRVYTKNPDKHTIVKSKLLATSSRPEVSIDWRVYTKDPLKPLIRDLIIEGLSLARTQKEEFKSVIQNNNNDINALFRTLEEFINK